MGTLNALVSKISYKQTPQLLFLTDNCVIKLWIKQSYLYKYS